MKVTFHDFFYTFFLRSLRKFFSLFLFHKKKKKPFELTGNKFTSDGISGRVGERQATILSFYRNFE